jgi:hypothetical protein
MGSSLFAGRICWTIKCAGGFDPPRLTWFVASDRIFSSTFQERWAASR